MMLLLLLLFFVVHCGAVGTTTTDAATTTTPPSSSSSYPSCNPLLCACQDASSADCSGRRFLSFPVGLPPSLAKLDLSDNALASVNASEMAQVGAVKELDLSRNQLAEFAPGELKHLQVRLIA